MARARDEQAAAEKAAAEAVEARIRGREEERERCLAICALWPDNLMAKEIAKRIRAGVV
jgi:hypothetical protein